MRKVEEQRFESEFEVENRKLRVHGDGAIPIIISAHVVFGCVGKEVREENCLFLKAISMILTHLF